MNRFYKLILSATLSLLIAIGLVSFTPIHSNAMVTSVSKKAYVAIYNPTATTATITIAGKSMSVKPKKYGAVTIDLKGKSSVYISYSFTNGKYYKKGYETVSGGGYIKRGNNYYIKPKTRTVAVDTGEWGINQPKLAPYVYKI